MKICAKCNETKILHDFGKNHRTEDGYRHQCRDCLRPKRDGVKDYLYFVKAAGKMEDYKKHKNVNFGKI